MAASKSTRAKRPAPFVPPPTVTITPRAPVRDLEPLEAWYLECLERVTAHLGRPPSTIELAAKIDRTTTPTYRMLVRLEALGYAVRDVSGKFHVRPVA